VPGYRLHFLSEDRRAGGQVLALEREGARLVIDDRPGFHLELPTDGAFLAAGHGGNRLAEIRGIEKRKRYQIPLISFRYTGVRPILTEA